VTAVASGRRPSLLVVAVIVVACGQDEGPGPDSSAGGASAGPGADTIATAQELPDPTGQLPGEPVDLGPREGDVLAVVGVAHDDVLRLARRSGR